jgi:hypothetical protein
MISMYLENPSMWHVVLGYLQNEFNSVRSLDLELSTFFT